MHLPNTFLILISLIASFALADISISSPGAGKTFSGTSGVATVDVEWIDDGSDPSLSKFDTYTFKLCTGPNTNIKCFATLAEESKADITDKSYTAAIQAAACADGLFYIQVTAVTGDGYTIHYTNRFTLEGMTGAQQASGKGASPDAVNSATGDAGATTALTINSKSFSITYTLQTGKTRFAPMQMQPGSKVTATTWSRRFPTSAVTYYTTKLKTPVVLSTITPGWSYTVESLINYATPALDPSVLGWYAASERVQSATSSSYASAKTSSSDNNKRRKRWDID